MPTLNIPEETFQRLTKRAAALNVTVEELIRPAIERLTSNGDGGQQMQPLTGEAWLRELEAWRRDAQARDGRYPPGHVTDDSRETIYAD